MSEESRIAKMQERYLSQIQKAQILPLGKEQLACYVEAATLQYQLSTLTAGEASAQHLQSTLRLIDLIRAGMKDLGIVPKELPQSLPPLEPESQPETPSRPAAGSQAAPEADAPANADEEAKELGLNMRDIRFEEVPSVTFNDLIDMTDSIQKVKSYLDNAMRMKEYPALAQQMQNEGQTGMLLYGPPGTGKTFFCKTMANYVMTHQPGGAFFTITAGQILDKYVGEAQKRLKFLFKELKNYDFPVLCIDELEGLCPSREGDASVHTQELVSDFLQHIDGVSGKTKAMVIGCSNYPWKIDRAVRDRLSELCYLGLPSENAIRVYLQRKSAKFLGATPEEQEKAIDFIIPRLSHASYRILDKFARDVQNLSFFKTTDANPKNKDVATFLPLNEKELNSILDQLIIAYDEAYIKKLEDPSSWSTD